MNFYLYFATGLIPLLTGFIWYNEKVFGKAWMKASGFDPSKAGKSNMGLIFLLTYVFGVMLSVTISSMAIHQISVGSIFADIPGSDQPGSDLMLFMEKYGTLYRTFKHGALHGFIGALFFAMPIIGTVSLFERRGAKYIFIHTGYWAITMLLMGGVLCQWM